MSPKHPARARKKTPQKEIWILGGIVATQDSERRVLKANVRIVDGQIAAITPSKPKSGTRAKIIRADGLTIFPGFVQTHVHLCQTLFRNQADDLELLDWLSKKIWIMESAHTPETLYTSALAGIQELLSSGTTCILDMGTVRHTSSILEAVKETGIRASVGKCLMDNPDHAPEYLRDSTDGALQEAVSLYEKWNGAENDRIRISYAPRFVVSCTETLLREVQKLSQQQHAVVHTHASENRGEIELVKKITGLENIEYLEKMGLTSPSLVLAHCIWLNDREKKILQTTRTHVSHCPSSNLKLGSGIAPIPEYLSRGMNVSLGADGAACNNTLNMFQEMRLAALIQKPIHGPKSMRAQDVLDMATRNGATALGWFDQIGSLEVGKKADLFAMNLEEASISLPRALALDGGSVAAAAVYSGKPSDVRFTLVDGRLVFDGGAARNPSKQTSSLLKSLEKAHRLIAKRSGVQTQQNLKLNS